jgi:hypothetical protein
MESNVDPLVIKQYKNKSILIVVLNIVIIFLNLAMFLALGLVDGKVSFSESPLLFYIPALGIIFGLAGMWAGIVFSKKLNKHGLIGALKVFGVIAILISLIIIRGVAESY